MNDDRKDQPGSLRPVNDNAPKTGERLDPLVLDMARLIGRQMARDDFEQLRKATANDNDRSRSAGGDGDGATED